jgi:urease accessory protein
MTRTIALLLSDARFPSGGHAHSGGVEQACDQGCISDVAGLEDFLCGRLRTSGAVAAHAAAAVCAQVGDQVASALLWREVDRELDARILAPTLRTVSRQQGGQLLRTARRVLDASPLLSLASDSHSMGRDPHHAVAVGAVAAGAGLTPLDAAAAACYAAVAGPASAALRLLGLDPAHTSKVVAVLTEEMDRIAAAAGQMAMRPFARLPSFSAPMTDLLAEEHCSRKDRLFAS